jgi:tetratricopeptide (TPR) repeat protein
MDRVEPPVSELAERGRDCYQRRRWSAAFDALAQADEIQPLSAPDLWLLAWSAHLTGRDADFARTMGRAYRAYLDEGESLRAARCAGWLGAMLGLAGESGPGAGWLSRARRLIERESLDCPERGFLILLAAFDHAEAGEYDAMLSAASQAFEVAERFGDADLAAIALVLQGRARLARGETKAGLALLDEAMVSVTTDQLLPALTGLAYCNVIEGCQEVYDLRRSQEWTAALTRWCDGQPDLVPYAGQCLVHRSEILQLHGDWTRALDEAVRACDRLAGQPAIANAHYQLAEIYRLRVGSRRPSMLTVVAVSSGESRSPGLPCCDSPRDVSMLPSLPFNGYSKKRRIDSADAGCCPRTPRSCWLPRRSAQRSRQPMSCSRSPRRSGHRFSEQPPRKPKALCHSRRMVRQAH